MAFLVISEKVVKDQLDKLNINKSSGPDGVSSEVLTGLREGLAKPFQLLFQKSLEAKWLCCYEKRLGNLLYSRQE